MTRHASAAELASLDLEGLRPRRAARVRAHLATCVRCTQLERQITAVPVVLASLPFPSMPANVTAQLDSALSGEAMLRAASAPETEAGRRDLPARRTGKQRERWQLPVLSVRATQVAAAASAVVVLGVGGYEVATHVIGNGNARVASSTGSAALRGARQMTLGPMVQYGQPTAPKTVRAVHADTNFTRADLSAQAAAAVRAAGLEGAHGSQAGGVAAPTTSGSSATNASPYNQAAPKSSLTSCLDGIVGNQPVQLVETARFEGQPATIIVTAQSAAAAAQVWAVGPACSASHPDVLAHQKLSHT